MDQEGFSRAGCSFMAQFYGSLPFALARKIEGEVIFTQRIPWLPPSSDLLKHRSGGHRGFSQLLLWKLQRISSFLPF